MNLFEYSRGLIALTRKKVYLVKELSVLNDKGRSALKHQGEHLARYHRLVKRTLERCQIETEDAHPKGGLWGKLANRVLR